MKHPHFTFAKLLGFSTLLLANITDARAAELVTNGGFETGNAFAWIMGGDLSFTGVNTGGYEHSGSFGMFLGTVGSDASVTQVLATTPGQQYDVSFWLQNYDSGGPNDFTAYFDGVPLVSLLNSTAFGYTEFSYPGLVATTSATTLQFFVRHDPSYYFLDDISVTDNVSEVPFGVDSTTGLALLGAASAWKLRRRRR